MSEVARIAGVSVRTLHHYDDVGLLVPKERTEAGYRVYDEDDLLRLQQILLGRELGLALEEIRRSLDDPDFDPAQYEAEVQQRWGETGAYRESAKRSKRYGEDDWRRIQEEQAAVYVDAAAAQRDGHAPESAEAMDVAERHRRSIERWFYPCGPAMHVNLADLWEADPRFAESIDAHGAGLTAFLAAAVRAHARRHGG